MELPLIGWCYCHVAVGTPNFWQLVLVLLFLWLMELPLVWLMLLPIILWSLSFGATSSSFRVLPLLKWTSMPYFFHITNKSGIIYRFKCDRLECDEEYIGETARTFGDRLKEHLKAPSPIYDHSNTTGHNVNINNFSIVGRKEQNLSRLIKESMFIRVNNPSLNKNMGKYHLPHVWDEVLISNIELKLK